MSKVIKKYEIFSDSILKSFDDWKMIFVFGRIGREAFIVTENDRVYIIRISNLKTNYILLDDALPMNDLCKKGVIDFTYGLKHVLALTRSGKIFCWFNSALGPSEADDNTFSPTFLSPIDEFVGRNVMQIKCGCKNSLVLTRDGQVFIWDLSSSTFKSKELKILNKIDFNHEKVVEISCGAYHFLALTENGHLFSWGDNNFGQLGSSELINPNHPNLIELNSIGRVMKISCGVNYSLILSSSNNIYAFGQNNYGQLGDGTYLDRRTPVKINKTIKFIDIASHCSTDISVALSIDGVYYIWGLCGVEVKNSPQVTEFNSFNDVFASFFKITYKTINFSFESIDPSIDDGRFNKTFDSFGTIASGSFGTVIKARLKSEDEIFAIKIILLEKSYIEIVKREIDMIAKIRNELIVNCKSFWFESEKFPSAPDSHLSLYIQMEYCSFTLKEIISQIKTEFLKTEDEILSPIGYFISSEIFEEILKGVEFLHKQAPPIIHRDLKPTNILLTECKNGKFVKISDFGLATFHEFNEQTHTEGIGSMKYMAPEVLTRSYDTKADIFSLGVIMEELFVINSGRLV
jgi:hypothetical protein